MILANYPGRRGLRRSSRARSASRCRACEVEVQRADGTPLRAGRDRRDQGVAARRLVPHQGPRPDRRGRLLLPRRPRRRRDHLRGLDDERGRDRGRAAQASRRARGGGDRRARRAARPGGQGLHREPAPRRRRPSRASCRTSRAPGSSQHEYPRQVAFVAELPKTPGRQGQPQGAARREAGAPTGGPRPGERRMPLEPSTAASRRSPRRHSTTCARRIGVTITDTLEPWCHEATRDSIRHYAHGIGDDNPLWCDPDYAAAHALGRHRRAAELPLRHEPHHLGLRRRPAGVHAMWAGADWTWHLPVRRNDAITTEAWLKDLIEHQTQFAGRAIQQIYHVDFSNQRGELVADAESWCFRTDRDHAREQGTKYTALKARSPQALHGRGAGRDLRALRGRGGPRAPSPATGTTCTVGRAAAHDGEGADDGHRLHRLRPGLGRPLHPRQQARLEADAAATPGSASRIASAFPTAPSACTGSPSSPPTSARRAPTTTGPERCSWLTHHLTNWMGDDGFLRRAHCKIRRHNPEGDTLLIDGTVMGKRVEDGRHLRRDRAGSAQSGWRAVGGRQRRRRAPRPRLTRPLGRASGSASRARSAAPVRFTRSRL